MRIHYLKLLVYGFVFAIIFGGCKKDKDLLPVSDYLKKMIPYKKGQIIKFVSTDNETITAKVEIEEGIEQCTTCEPAEKRQVFDFVLRNTATVDYTKVATMEIIDRAENYVFMTIYSPLGNFMNGTGFDFQTVNKTPQFFADNQRYFLRDNVTIGSKRYTNVLEINYNVYNNLRENDLAIVYYSKEKGILKFEYKNGKAYQLAE